MPLEEFQESQVMEEFQESQVRGDEFEEVQVMEEEEEIPASQPHDESPLKPGDSLAPSPPPAGEPSSSAPRNLEMLPTAPPHPDHAKRKMEVQARLEELRWGLVKKKCLKFNLHFPENQMMDIT